MAIVIEVETTRLTTKKGTSARTGKEYEIHEQPALMFKDGSRYPDKIKIAIQDGNSAYPVGRYSLHDDSFQVSRFGGLEIRPVLTSLPANLKATA